MGDLIVGLAMLIPLAVVVVFVAVMRAIARKERKILQAYGRQAGQNQALQEIDHE